MIARLPALLLVLIATLLLAAGCGDDSGSGDSGSGGGDTTTDPDDDGGGAGDDAASGGQVLELGVDGNQLAFDTTELTATAGTVTLRLENTSTIQHNVAIEDESGEELGAGELVGDGEVSKVTVSLEPGTYTYFCAPHKSSGMTGTLTVT